MQRLTKQKAIEYLEDLIANEESSAEVERLYLILAKLRKSIALLDYSEWLYEVL